MMTFLSTLNFGYVLILAALAVLIVYCQLTIIAAIVIREKNLYPEGSNDFRLVKSFEWGVIATFTVILITGFGISL